MNYRIIACFLAATCMSCSGWKNISADEVNVGDRQDFKGIYQAILDDTLLEQYFHPGKPDRKPLRVSERVVGKNIQLSKFNMPVRIIPQEEESKGPVFIFSKMKIRPDEAIVTVNYRIEEVTGEFLVKKQAGRWIVHRASVHEN